MTQGIKDYLRNVLACEIEVSTFSRADRVDLDEPTNEIGLFVLQGLNPKYADTYQSPSLLSQCRQDSRQRYVCAFMTALFLIIVKASSSFHEEVDLPSI